MYSGDVHHEKGSAHFQSLAIHPKIHQYIDWHFDFGHGISSETVKNKEIMPPPPSQQGKFKPRKPPPKKAPSAGGASSGTSGTDGGGTSSTDNQGTTPSAASAIPRAESATEDRKGRSGDMGGRGGDGRDGRGRGRGRAPIPSGRVFFTGAVDSSSSGRSKQRGPSSAQVAAAAAASRTIVGKSVIEKGKGKDAEGTEEVVGQLETAIGTGVQRNTSLDENKKAGGMTALDYEMSEQGASDAATKGSFAFDAFMYDTDSSREVDDDDSEEPKAVNIRPLELPFPSHPLPLGIGSVSRPVAYESVTNANDANPSGVGGTIHQELPEPAMSPFVDSTDRNNLAWEQNSWFLVQLPTRLPPLQSAMEDQPNTVHSSDDPMGEDPDRNESSTTRSASLFSDVVTQPLASKSHDAILTSTAPGRIGKFIVYKSGRTVLKLEGPEGTEPIYMQVSEGLSCTFHQEAVVIDQEKATYVGLGKVNKSIVVTPDLSSTLAAD